MPDEERKIIIDEDWKAQVEREREEAQRKAREAQAAAKPEGEQAAAPAAEEEGPESLFMTLVSNLAAQAMMALGVIVPRGEKEVLVDLQLGKHLVDTLMMLRDKTKGNITPRERGLLDEAISELQRVYAVRAQQIHEAALRQAGVKPQNPKA